jgi:hypothetical protein
MKLSMEARVKAMMVANKGPEVEKSVNFGKIKDHTSIHTQASKYETRKDFTETCAVTPMDLRPFGATPRIQTPVGSTAILKPKR